MIRSWIKSFLTWISGLLVHEAAEQVREEIQKPSTIQDEKLPDGLSDGLQSDIANKLRNLDGGNK